MTKWPDGTPKSQNNAFNWNTRVPTSFRGGRMVTEKDVIRTALRENPESTLGFPAQPKKNGKK